MERIATLYHGTTLTRAQRIVIASAFSPFKTFFTLGERNRDLSEIFARRTANRHPDEGGPALVIVTLEEAAFESLRKLGLFRLLPFDAEDAPALRIRNQWVLDAGGVERLNNDIDEWRWERV